MKQVSYSRAAVKALLRMPRQEAERIRGKIEQYAREPASLANNVRALTGSPYLRLRVGDWRVIMNDAGAILEIVRIGPRGGVYD